MADTYTTFAAMANDAPNVFIARKMIELLNRMLVIDKCSEPFALENGNSKTLRVVRVARVALPNTPLIEGVTPSTDSLTLENVNVTVEQWGLVVALTDVLELTVQHPMVSLAIERVAMAMKETSEREDAEVLMGATNVTFPGVVTTRSGLAATDVFNTALAISVNTKLEMRGAHKYMDNGGYYMGFMQPPHKAAVLGSDQTFQQASNFAQQERLMYGRVGMWMGVEWIMGNFLPVYVGVAAATTAAATATKAQYTVGTSGTLATANYQLKVVGREVTTDYERRLSVQTGNIAVTSPGSIAVVMPSSANYSYDVYLTQAGGTVAYLIASRQTAGSTYTITTAPAGTEAVAPESPALNINVYPGFVLGKGAFGTCTLNGMSLQTFTTPKGASDSDPLAQRRKVGAKYMRKSFILDNNYIERFETSSAFAAAIPA
jgi:N4-gp56 family major capsid protein